MTGNTYIRRLAFFDYQSYFETKNILIFVKAVLVDIFFS